MQNDFIHSYIHTYAYIYTCRQETPNYIYVYIEIYKLSVGEACLNL